MDDTRTVLETRLRSAFDAVEPGADPVLRPSDHADFQANGALALAKRLNRAPRELAAEIAAAAFLDDICETVEVSGPGFINLTLAVPFIAGQLSAMVADDRLGVPVAEQERIIIDYSSPNVAKEMHVGHLRGTVIGDALTRMLSFVGHHVRRENHIGDWGTPFGMLIEHLVDLGEEKGVLELSVGDLDTFYRQARASFDADETFRDRSRARVVLLQSGDPETLRLWRVLVAESVRYFDEVYAKLGVLLTDDDIVGESFYNPLLPVVVEELDAKGLLVEDDGALCVFPDGFENRHGEPLPLIVRKSDGGYGYPATDLAAVRDRTGRLGATRLVYVVGSEQSLHLRLVFAVAVLAGYLPDASAAIHAAFGMVLG
ncbi:MAG TPA: arginine--tRNA ligase, partial [Acidimicrobiales bacterium]